MMTDAEKALLDIALRQIWEEVWAANKQFTALGPKALGEVCFLQGVAQGLVVAGEEARKLRAKRDAADALRKARGL